MDDRTVFDRPHPHPRLAPTHNFLLILLVKMVQGIAHGIDGVPSAPLLFIFITKAFALNLYRFLVRREKWSERDGKIDVMAFSFLC